MKKLPPTFIALIGFIYMLFITSRAHAQGAADQADAKVFWWDDKPAAKELPPPIVPDHWIVVPSDLNVNPARVFLQGLLDPHGDPPEIGAQRKDGLVWQSRETKSPAIALAAYACITSARDEVRMARLTGAEYLFVNGDGFVGDSENRGFRGVPVALKKGVNRLYVLGIHDSFELELWCPETRAVLGTWDVAWPGEIPTADDFAYPVFNASTRWADSLHVHYGHAVVEGSSCKPAISDWRCGQGGMLPLGLFMAGSYFLALDSDCDPTSDEQAALVPICVYVAGDPSPDQRLLRRAPASERKLSRARQTPRARSVIAGSPLARLSNDPVFVPGSGEAIARARFDQELCWYRTWITPEAITDKYYATVTPNRNGNCEASRLAWATRDSCFVLYGNADTNMAWDRLVPGELPIRVRQGSLRVNDIEFSGDDICGWFVMTTKDQRRVVAIADTGPRGARLGYLVQPLFSKAEGLDYAFWDSHGDDGMPRLIASGVLPH
jgi:hypothetical protein